MDSRIPREMFLWLLLCGTQGLCLSTGCHVQNRPHERPVGSILSSPRFRDTERLIQRQTANEGNAGAQTWSSEWSVQRPTHLTLPSQTQQVFQKPWSWSCGCCPLLGALAAHTMTQAPVTGPALVTFSKRRRRSWLEL